MSDVAIVKMSSKGQLVVPEDIRENNMFRPGDLFVPVEVRSGIIFRKLIMPEVRAEIERSRKELRATLRKNKVKKKTIDEAIRWARRSS